MQSGIRVKREKKSQWPSVAYTLLLASAFLMASDKKPVAGSAVDSGTFGVFMNGSRVATETFSISQDANGSSITSQFKSEAGTNKAEQTSSLQLSASGDLKIYEWNEITPGHSHATVEPNESFLIEHVWKNQGDKPLDQPFLLPASTTILDDYFFVHREVLAWRYLATSCKQDKGVQCPLKQQSLMGTLNPHARASMSVKVEFTGREKVNLHGTERELIRLDMSSETGDWSVWLDDSLKMQRIVIPIENTEVVRD